MGCCPWDRKELDTTERLHFHFSLSCIGEGNGSPLQCSWLENPRDRGAWWAAVYGVAQSRTRLKQLSSSISSNEGKVNCRWRCETVNINTDLGPVEMVGTVVTCPINLPHVLSFLEKAVDLSLMGKYLMDKMRNSECKEWTL